MTDENFDHAALIAEARSWPEGSDKTMGEMFDALAAALEAVQQTPAVEREAAEKVLYGVTHLSLMGKVDALIASGILLDAAEVEARGLERLLDAVTESGLVHTFGGEKFVSVALLVSEVRAQQVRKGNRNTHDSEKGA